MGSKKIGLLFIFFTCLNLIQSSYALRIRTLLPDHNLKATEMLKHGSFDIEVDSAGNKITHLATSKRIGGGGGSRGGSGGSSHGGADNGNGGNSGQGRGGGAAVIPVVVAGAANNNHNHNHHGAANRNCIPLPILVMINMASLIFLRITTLNADQ